MRRRRAHRTGGRAERGEEPTYTAYMLIHQSWFVIPRNIDLKMWGQVGPEIRAQLWSQRYL